MKKRLPLIIAVWTALLVLGVFGMRSSAQSLEEPLIDVEIPKDGTSMIVSVSGADIDRVSFSLSPTENEDKYSSSGTSVSSGSTSRLPSFETILPDNDGVYRISVSPDPELYREAQISVMIRADLRVENYVYKLLPVIPDKKQCISFPNQEIQTGEVWIFDMNRYLPMKPGALSPEEEPDRKDTSSAFFLHNSLKISPRGSLFVLGEGDLVVGGTPRQSGDCELILDADSRLVAKVDRFFVGIGNGSGVSSSATVLVNGGRLDLDTAELFNGFAWNGATVQSKISIVSGVSHISVENAFYNGGDGAGFAGEGIVEIYEDARMQIKSGEDKRWFKDYPSLKIADADYFVNGESRTGVGRVRFVDAQGEPRFGILREWTVPLQEADSFYLLENVDIDGISFPIEWETEDLSLSEVGTQVVRGSFAAYHTENICVETVLNITKNVRSATILPVLSEVTADRIYLTRMENAEFSIDNGTTWTTNASFSGLRQDTQYAILARLKETKTDFAGPSGLPLMVRTLRDPYAADASSVKIRIRTLNGKDPVVGKPFVISVSSDGTSILRPQAGDRAFFPVGWSIGKRSGTWSSEEYSMTVAANSAGPRFITMYFEEREFNGSSWEATGENIRKVARIVVSPYQR